MTRVMCLAASIACGLAWTAAADEYKTVNVKEYGYSMKIPSQLEMTGDKVDKTTSWIYQPGSDTADQSKKKAKKFGLGKVKIGPVSLGDAAEATESDDSGGLEPAVQVYVNWTWMPDVSSKTLFDANFKSDKQNAESPDPDYKDLVVMTKENGYPNFKGGYAYWFKEVDKDDDDEIHRWHIKAFGNKSSYTVGLTGTYGQFKEWGPKFEEVIKSFTLIELEGKN